MQEIADWLEKLGLGQYARRFADNDISLAILGDLGDQDLKEIGVSSLGHRRQLLRAITALRDGAENEAPSLSDAEFAHVPNTGERRHLTVLFCDLVGSTEIAARLDPEEWRDIVSDYHHRVEEVVGHFGGYVAQKYGDGAMLYFGYPLAQENDAERAVRSGLAIVEAVAKQNGTPEAEGLARLAVRVGIHTGQVVINETAAIFGDVPNVAARVQTAAEPGSVLVTGDVHRLISGLFVALDRGRQTLKGVPEPVGLFQIVRASGAVRRRTAGRGVTPLVGREEELRLIASRWDRARAGQGQLVLLIGEPGLGKTRVIEELQRRIAELPHTWAELTCSQLLQNTPFHPFLQFARQRLEEQEATPEGRVAALAAWHRAVGLDPGQSVPLVAPLLELQVPADYAPAADAPEERRRRLIATLVAWVIGGARVQPILLVIEDLHWIDPSTLEFLRVLTEQGAAASLLILATARPEFRVPWPHRSHHNVITLSPLERNDVLRMVGELAARHALSGEVLDALVYRTGGVPLFIEELTRLLLKGDSHVGTQQIPLTLQASLAARLDRLGSAREVAQIGAVLGREFSYPLIRAAAGLSDTSLTVALDRLTDADLNSYPRPASRRELSLQACASARRSLRDFTERPQARAAPYGGTRIGQ